MRIFPLDRIEADRYKHALVIIGRRRGSDTPNYTTLADDAVICDPWRDVFATIKSEAK